MTGTAGPRHETAERVRLLALVWLTAAVVGFGVAALAVGLPRNPEGNVLGSAVEGPAQVGLLALAAIGGLAALRRRGAGAVVVAVAAVGLGLVASVQYTAGVAATVTVAFAVPAFLLWVAWQHGASLGRGVVLAVVSLALLGTGATIASRVRDHFYGPTHPESPEVALPVDLVEWVWSGDLRPDGATVVAALDGEVPGGADATLVVTDPGGGARLAASAPVVDGYVRLVAHGLEPGTPYTYAVTVDGSEDGSRGRGRFTTAPVGPASFTIAAGSCARTGSSGAVFDAIREADPLVYLATGDLHYSNLTSTDPAAFLDAYRRVLTAPAQAALYRAVPVDYVWDDHDYGPNDADASSPGRDAVRSAYRTAVPHPDLVLGDDGAIAHAFTLGRVRVVVTDTRSERTDDSILGDEQMTWLLEELRQADSYGLVLWVNPDPWIAPAEAGRDDWGGYADDRRRVADTIADAGVDNLVMVSGDAHMVAIDDGTNSDFATDGGAGFPVLHAAALDRSGSVKGGPYSEGAFPGAGQFGLIHIDDDGSTIEVTLEGRTWEGDLLTDLTVSFPPTAG